MDVPDATEYQSLAAPGAPSIDRHHRDLHGHWRAGAGMLGGRHTLAGQEHPRVLECGRDHRAIAREGWARRRSRLRDRSDAHRTAAVVVVEGVDLQHNIVQYDAGVNSLAMTRTARNISQQTNGLRIVITFLGDHCPWGNGWGVPSATSVRTSS